MADNEYMKRAAALAKKGYGHTSPNPVVGAVVVKKGKIVGEGYHKRAGGKHAEALAIEQAGSAAKGATLYVTLEPCCHHGRTPPCTQTIIDAGIAQVVIGSKDPYPKVHGRGSIRLRRSGISVRFLSKKDAMYTHIVRLNQPFFKWAGIGLPYVTLKAGMSLDGNIATRSRDTQWITSEAARKDARKERSVCDAVLVGAGTVAADDPMLASHGRWANKALLRIIIDPHLALPTTKQVFRDDNVFVATTRQASTKNQERYTRAGIAYKSFGAKRVSLKRLLQYLGKREIEHVYVEGGSGTHGYFVDDAQLDPLLVDRILFYIEPVLLGGTEALSVIGGKGVRFVKDGIRLHHVQTESIGGTMKVEAFTQIYEV